MPIPQGPATTLMTYDGNQVDLVMTAFLDEMAELLGYPISVTQGYNPSNTTTSAGTHYYGVVDLPAWDHVNKLRVIGQLGGFGWYRPTIIGLWGEHIHFGIRNHPGLADIAADQQKDFDGTPPRTGLKGHAVDLAVYNYRPQTPVEFVYPVKAVPPMKKPTPIQEARSDMAKMQHLAESAIAHLRDASPKRVKPRSFRDDLREMSTDLTAMLTEMPKK